MKCKILAILALCALPAATVLAQTPGDNDIVLKDTKGGAANPRNFVTETGAFKNRFGNVDEVRVVAIGNSYNQTLKNGMELLVQNPDQSWSMYVFEAGPKLKAQLDRLNTMASGSSDTERKKLEAEIVKIFQAKLPSLLAQIAKPGMETSTRIAEVSLLSGATISLPGNVSAAPDRPQKVSVETPGAGLVDKFKRMDEMEKATSIAAYSSVMGARKDLFWVYDSCDTISPLSIYTTDGLKKRISQYKTEVPPSDSGFRYGADGGVYIDGSNGAPVDPAMVEKRRLSSQKFQGDVRAQLPNLFPANGQCRATPFRLKLEDRPAIILEDNDAGSPLVGTRFSDGVVFGSMRQYRESASGNSFTDTNGAIFAAAVLDGEFTKIAIWNGKTISLYRPSAKLYELPTVEERVAALKKTPVTKGLTILGLINGYKEAAKAVPVNEAPPQTSSP